MLRPAPRVAASIDRCTRKTHQETAKETKACTTRGSLLRVRGASPSAPPSVRLGAASRYRSPSALPFSRTPPRSEEFRKPERCHETEDSIESHRFSPAIRHDAPTIPDAVSRSPPPGTVRDSGIASGVAGLLRFLRFLLFDFWPSAQHYVSPNDSGSSHHVERPLRCLRCLLSNSLLPGRRERQESIESPTTT